MSSLAAPSIITDDEDDGGHHHIVEAHRPAIHCLPFQFVKIVHLVRHGEGFHNVAGRLDHENYKLEQYADSHLTELGWRQAAALRAHVAALPAGLKPEVVYVSPLVRALETAVGAFGGPLLPNHSGGGGRDGANGGAAGGGGGGGLPPLMLAIEEEEGVRATHPAVSAEGAPPFIAVEGCREHHGVHPCDRRRLISHVSPLFPGVDFSLIEHDEDVLWDAQVREGKAAIRARGAAFMRWLASRPERCVAVVTHSSFLHFAMTNYGAHASTAVQGAMHLWYENCEMRTVVLADEAAARPAAPEPCHFPGGHHAVQ